MCCKNMNFSECHCVKSVRIWSFTGSYFSAFGLRDTEYRSVFSLNAGKYGPENSEYGHFSRSVYEMKDKYTEQ